MFWLDKKYASLISSRVSNFKIKSYSPFLANMRCNYCGDSKKNKSKARGYIYENNSSLFYRCHNCGASTTFSKFLEHVDPSLHNEYKLEYVKEVKEEKPVFIKDIGKFSKPRFSKYEHLKNLKKISQLDVNHPAVNYIKARMIPSKYHYKLYFCPKFAHWVNEIFPDKFNEVSLQYDEPRLIIPFIDDQGYLFGFQGRSFKKETNLRYITIMIDDTKQKIFGLDTVDFTEPVYVLEGPIDSMFIPNSIAMAGADGISNLITKDKDIIIYDNQPRNQIIVKKIFSTIKSGYQVVIWPDSIKEKDINDLIKSGWTQAEILECLSSNTCKDLTAFARLNSWKKVTI